MSAYGSFESSVQKAMHWLDELQKMDGILNREEAFSVLRTVLHALRDRLTVEESAHLSAQLPAAIRGIYYESWRPAETPQRYERDEFIQTVNEGLSSLEGKYDPEAMVSSVLALLENHISEGEIEHIKAILPKSFDDLWPEKIVA